MNKIIFLANYLNQHQIEFCDTLYNKLKSNFLFYSTEAIDQLEKGSQLLNIHRPYLHFLNHSKFLHNLDTSDVIIFASGPKDLLISLVKRNLIVFFYSERLFKKNVLQAFHPGNILEYFRFYRKIDKKNVYFLAAGNYVSKDLSIYNLFKDRILKWGYFPSFKKYTLNELVKLKSSNKINILWIGRMIYWKKPFIIINIAKFLLENEINNFSITVIGKGYLLNKFKNMIRKYKLENFFYVVDSVKSSQIYKYYSKSHIFISTSNRQEGWGATINEALSYGCHTFADHNIGASKFLINNKFYEYINLNHLKNNLLELILTKNYLNINKVGFNKIKLLWNGSKAAYRFITFTKSLNYHKQKVYTDGPLSKL